MELSLYPLLLHAFCHLVSATAEPCLPAAGLVIPAAATCWFPLRDVPAGYYHCKIHRLNLSAKAKRCRIHLSKRQRLTTANIKFQRLLLLLSSNTDQTLHFHMRPALFPSKRPNEQDSLLYNLIHLTAAQLFMTSRLLKSSISLDDVTTAEYFSFASIQTFLLHNC
ncbi:chloride channel/carrier, CIC family [Dorcoceras hygrometricum]|uniref:Chloride channel/carrier, CIC family n=1 Tax=Dorcoceras hygrometricum TaxID=472368 RepID=A0A2Z7C102_9LAMI|nr:chloride channel/carrier, CIC family [Dorcoceras hygrometricum]